MPVLQNITTQKQPETNTNPIQSGYSFLSNLYEKGTDLGKDVLDNISNTLNTVVDSVSSLSSKGTNSERADTFSPLSPPSQYSKAKGMMSTPTPGAHVWVMFENGDPNYPIVLGAIYGQSDYQGIHDIPSTGIAPKQEEGTISGGYGKEYEKGSVTGKPGSGRWLKKYDDADGSMVTAADKLQKKVGIVPTYRCYNYVKNGIMANGCVTNEQWFANAGTDTSAKDAGPALTSRGFSKLNITDPEKAPPGAVIVYSGGKDGHIEMKTSDGGYVSDFYHKTPSPRQVSGIYVK